MEATLTATALPTAARPSIPVPLARLGRPRFALHPRGSAQRAGVEHYIAERFASAHRARLQHYLPNLITFAAGERLLAAVGLAPAGDGALFSEAYLASPIEHEIARLHGQPVARADILEIGNLASTWKGSGLLLFVFLSELIDRLGYRWVVFTITPKVERLLATLGYLPIFLADADPARLSDAGASWGSYYGGGPRVMTGAVAPAVAAARGGLLYRTLAALVADQVGAVCAAYAQRNASPTVGTASLPGHATAAAHR